MAGASQSVRLSSVAGAGNEDGGELPTCRRQSTREPALFHFGGSGFTPLWNCFLAARDRRANPRPDSVNLAKSHASRAR